MAKLKNPLFSLGVKGTIADTVTFQKLPRLNIAREKPKPKDARTLPQIYHRWLYQDYLAWWATFTSPEKRFYAAKGSRHSTTAIGAFMGEYLQTLSDIAAFYRLDEPRGPIVVDSSKNGNNAIAFGAVPSTGIIAGCFSFDGIDDYIDCGNDHSLEIPGAMTVEAFFNTTKLGTNKAIIIKSSAAVANVVNYYIVIRNTNLLQSRIGNGVTYVNLDGPNVVDGNWYHVALVYDLERAYLYLNGEVYTSKPWAQTPYTETCKAYIGAWLPGTYHFAGKIDNVALYSRALADTEILLHSQRRYP
jgi:hypothetical protein